MNSDRAVSTEGAIRTMILGMKREHDAPLDLSFAVLRTGAPGGHLANWKIEWHGAVSPDLEKSAASLLDKFDVK